MKRCKKWLGAILVVMLLFTMACSTDKPSSGTDPGKDPLASASEGSGKTFTIGISLLYRQDEYYKDLEATFKNTAEKYGFELKIQDANLDLAAQTA